MWNLTILKLFGSVSLNDLDLFFVTKINKKQMIKFLKQPSAKLSADLLSKDAKALRMVDLFTELLPTK